MDSCKWLQDCGPDRVHGFDSHELSIAMEVIGSVNPVHCLARQVIEFEISATHPNLRQMQNDWPYC